MSSKDVWQNYHGKLKYRCRLIQYLFQDSEDIQSQIKAAGGGRKGECRVRRAGKILDVGVDGYYDTASCVPDFVKVKL